jgi:very-short-patch-repair endonuclease
LAVLTPRKIDVEVDGESTHRTAGGGRKDDDYWGDLQLQSLGWKVCWFWVYELREDLPRCVRRVLAEIRPSLRGGTANLAVFGGNLPPNSGAADLPGSG